MKPIDMTKVYQKYKGKWVAFKSTRSNTVIASGYNLSKVIEESHKQGIKTPVVTQIPKKVLPIFGPFKATQ